MNSRALYFAVHGVKPPRRSPRRRAGRGPARNWKYRGWIRSLPCACASAEPDCDCFGAIQAAHTQNNGLRTKGSDYSCVPLCAYHHQQYDSGLRSKELFEADHNLNLADLVRRLNHDWFAYSKEVK